MTERGRSVTVSSKWDGNCGSQLPMKTCGRIQRLRLSGMSIVSGEETSYAYFRLLHTGEGGWAGGK